MNTIYLEGTDKVGKHTATIATIKTLLISNYKVVFTDFPQYWYFGSVLRHALNHKDLNLKDGLREIEIRCALYSMDRLLSLINTNKYINEKNTILVSDRGWASNAITVGFGLSMGKLNIDQTRILMKNLSYFDQEFINVLNPFSLLLLPGINGQNAMDKGIKQREDLYEQDGPQKIALKLYQEYLKLDEIYTQENSQWRGVDQIAKDILSKAQILQDNKIKDVGIYGLSLDNILKTDNFHFLSPNIFFQTIYGKEWVRKKDLFKDLLDSYTKASWNGDKDSLKRLENEISLISFQNPPYEIHFEIPLFVKIGLKRNLEKYPEIESIMREVCGDNYYNYFSKVFF